MRGIQLFDFVQELNCLTVLAQGHREKGAGGDNDPGAHGV